MFVYAKIITLEVHITFFINFVLFFLKHWKTVAIYPTLITYNLSDTLFSPWHLCGNWKLAGKGCIKGGNRVSHFWWFLWKIFHEKTRLVPKDANIYTESKHVLNVNSKCTVKKLCPENSRKMVVCDKWLFFLHFLGHNFLRVHLSLALSTFLESV